MTTIEGWKINERRLFAKRIWMLIGKSLCVVLGWVAVGSWREIL
jgi:hypothetical protein